jgi:predicted metal-dependent hydrolase
MRRMNKRTLWTDSLTVDGIEAEVTYKDIKNIRLRVLPPDGRVRVSAPYRTPAENVERFVISQRDWIVQARAKARLMAPAREPLTDGGRALLWGEWHEVRLEEGRRVSARVDGRTIRLSAADEGERRQALENLYRAEIESAVPALHDRWAAITGRAASTFRYRRMTSRWGSCQPATGAISLNIALAERRPELLEYVLVHELTHLWERGHGPAFYARMDAALPDWRRRRGQLKGPL